MSTLENLEKTISKESVDRHIGDNELKMMLSDEQLKRAKQDAENKISLSNKSVERVTGDSSIYHKIYDEINARNAEILELKIKLSKLESKILANPDKYRKGTKSTVKPFEIINTIPYIESYTQGYVIHQGKLYESTGLYGKSVVRRIAIDGNNYTIEKEVKLDDKYFGEGITIFNNQIIQVTWKSQTGFVYDLDLNKLEEFNFTTTNNEGWGITHDSTNLIVSDGSSYLHFWDPVTKSEVRKVQVTNGGMTINNLNELEYHNGYVLANVWKTNNIVVIDPNNGNVVNTIDFSELAKTITMKNSDSVFNGIAFDGTNFYITGKEWAKIWYVKLNIGVTDNKTTTDNKLMISQEMFVRQLNMLKRSAKFILENTNVEQIAEDKDESVDFLIHLNNMQLTFDNLLANKDKYTLTEETSKCISEAESLKKQLKELSNNWDIDVLFVNRRSREGDCSDKRLKENIVLLGTTDENINVYQFNYIFDPMKVKHVGVIAQELLETEYKNNVYMHEDGFYRVDYKHLDMTFDGQLLPYLAK